MQAQRADFLRREMLLCRRALEARRRLRLLRRVLRRRHRLVDAATVRKEAQPEGLAEGGLPPLPPGSHYRVAPPRARDNLLDEISALSGGRDGRQGLGVDALLQQDLLAPCERAGALGRCRPLPLAQASGGVHVVGPLQLIGVLKPAGRQLAPLLKDLVARELQHPLVNFIEPPLRSLGLTLQAGLFVAYPLLGARACERALPLSDERAGQRQAEQQHQRQQKHKRKLRVGPTGDRSG